MPCTTFLYAHEKTNVKDKDLLELLNSNEFIKTHYVVRERPWVTSKRFLLIFEVEEHSTIYDVYYRYLGPDSEDVQVMMMPGNDLKSIQSYFLGLVNGLEENSKRNS